MTTEQIHDKINYHTTTRRTLIGQYMTAHQNNQTEVVSDLLERLRQNQLSLDSYVTLLFQTK